MSGPDMVELLARYDKRLFGLEARRPLCDYHVLGFSLSYELGGTNILEMLRLAGIPISWEVRYPPSYHDGPKADSDSQLAAYLVGRLVGWLLERML
eukprot:scaffold8044_cov42-Prasinocladus_malaysianus.AAC.1